MGRDYMRSMGTVRGRLALCLALLFSSGAGRAVADEAGSTSAPQDVVLLKNGGMVRGTISEMVPGDYVLIVSLAGESRRFAMVEVKYAGPAAQAPGAASAQTPGAVPAPAPSPTSSMPSSEPRPMVTVHGAEARLQLRATEPGIGFHRRSGSAYAFGPGGAAVAIGFDDICTAPCEITMPAGTHTLALSQGGGTPVAADPVAIPEGQATVEGTYTDRSGLRLAGWGVFVGTLLAGSYLVIDSIETTEECDEYGCTDSAELNTTKVAIGTGLMVVGPLASLALILQPDGAEIRVSAGVAVAPRVFGTSGGNPARDRAGVPAVLALGGRF